MTTTAADAYEAIRAHHRALGDGLTSRANAVFRAAVDGQPHEPAVADLIAYLGEEVLPHAAAEEKTIYPAVVAHTHLGDLVGDMITEHATLSMSAARLTTLTDGVAAAEQAQEIAALFVSHAARENDVLLPPLIADGTVDLAELLGRMHRNLEPAGSAHHCDCGHEEAADPDLDVRELRPAQRHVTIFDAYLALDPGTGFVLINDHDPKPLRYQFEAEHTGQFTWDVLEAGPAAWRVRIGRTAA
jgi:uncharacterized protein (DUF2249 family)